MFSNISDLRKLTKVYLNFNQLTTVDTWPFMRGQIIDGFDARFRNNSIRKFTNNIGWVYHCDRKKTINIHLTLTGNQIKHFLDVFNAFSFPNTTRIIDLLCFFPKYELINWAMDKNLLECDCIDYGLVQILRFASHASKLLSADTYCFPQIGPYAQSVRIFSVPLEQLICNIEILCPVGCTCRNQPSNRTFHVLCNAVGMMDLPLQLPNRNTPRSLFIVPSAHYKLDFSGNNIQNLTVRDYFSESKVLDLGNSGLKTVTIGALQSVQNISVIRLNNNLLRTLPSSIASMNFSFESLSLYGNPWSCACDQAWFKTWLVTIKNRLETPDGIICNSPEWLKGTNIFDVER